MSSQTITQATLQTWSTTPQALPVPRPSLPTPSSPLVQIHVLAAGLHTLVRLRATGTHYSASTLPHIPGADGVGRTVPDNQLVYFSTMAVPSAGSFTEYINLPRMALVPVPDGANPVQVAGLVNPAMASWMALATRVDFSSINLKESGVTVAILGVTSLSGTVAVSVSKIFGAAKIIGIARNTQKIQAIAGIDEAVQLKASPEGVDTTDWAGALDADIILDFLYGPATLGLFKALKPGKPVQYVQIGSSAKQTIDGFPGDIFRAKDLTVRGSGPGAWSMKEFGAEAPKIVEAVATGKIDEYKFREAKLVDVAEVWEGSKKSGERVVFVT